MLDPVSLIDFSLNFLTFSQLAHLQEKMHLFWIAGHNWQKAFVKNCSEFKQEHITTVVLIYCVVSNRQMKYHWDREKLLSFFFLLCCLINDLLLMLMRYVFTVVATSWLRYSRQLKRMLLSVIAESMLLIRD